MIAPALILFAAVLISAAATITDLRGRRIPNWLTYPTATAALVLHAALSGPPGFVGALVAALFAAFVFLPIFWLGGIGGGDAKLAIALGCLYGDFETTARLLLFTTIGAAIYACGSAFKRGVLLASMKRLVSKKARATTTAITIAYAPAFLFGAVGVAGLYAWERLANG